jgi:hypothetical protein
MVATMNINRLVHHAGKSIPGYPIVQGLMNKVVNHLYYQKKLSGVRLVESDMLILGTVARSGTHYMLLLLANYISHSIGDKNGYSPTEMNEIFPNNWHIAYLNYHNIPFGPYCSEPIITPDERISALGIKEVTRSHAIFQQEFWKNTKVLHLYRNPLDYSVSLFNYKHKKRPDLPNRLGSPSEVLELKFENYVSMYHSYVNATKAGKYRIFRMSYEELIMHPAFYLDAVLRWLGLEPVPHVVHQAVESSSINRTKDHEAKGAVINPTAHGLKGSFISSGLIGQWRRYYSKEDFSYWEKRFRAEGIELTSFTLE